MTTTINVVLLAPWLQVGGGPRGGRLRGAVWQRLPPGIRLMARRFQHGSSLEILTFRTPVPAVCMHDAEPMCGLCMLLTVLD